MSTTVFWYRHSIRRVWLATLLVLGKPACGPLGDDGSRWSVVLEYLDEQAAWEARAGRVGDLLRLGSGPPDEKMRRAQEAHGELPDATMAINAAREIVAMGGPQTVQATVFLLERSEGPLGIMDLQRELAKMVADGMDPPEALARLRAVEDPIWEALIARVGPDWEVVQKYLGAHDSLLGRDWSPARVGAPILNLHQRPSVLRAIAAARAILSTENVHEMTVEAAEFLLEQGGHRDRHPVAAARALVARVPSYDDWTRVLHALDQARNFSGPATSAGSPVEEFFAEMASDADNPVLRAAARYYAATDLRRRASAFMVSPEERAVHRERAEQMAMGLSAGVEAEPFDAPGPGPGPAAPDRRTFAEAEADLLATIRHGTVGGTLPEWTGRRLDGTKQPLSDYKGRVLMIDFWATWCPPCIAVLPDLRQLVSDLPSDKFALLAISVDAELATVTRFMEKEPMPWDNWHVGVSSEIERILGVGGFPTYLLVDADGTILFNGNAALTQLRCVAERAVAGVDPRCSPAD